MNALVRHPDQLAILRGRPDLVDGAVEEMLRYDAPFQMNLRMLTEDVEMDGVLMRQGDLVRQALGSANRDPSGSRTRTASGLNVRRNAISRSGWVRTSASVRRLRDCRHRSPWRPLCDACRTSASTPTPTRRLTSCPTSRTGACVRCGSRSTRLITGRRLVCCRGRFGYHLTSLRGFQLSSAEFSSRRS